MSLPVGESTPSLVGLEIIDVTTCSVRCHPQRPGSVAAPDDPDAIWGTPKEVRLDMARLAGLLACEPKFAPIHWNAFNGEQSRGH